MATAPPSTSSSSSNIDIDQRTDAQREHDDDVPTVDALTTPVVTHPSVRRQAETLRKLKAQEKEIAKQQAHLQDMVQALNSQREEYMQNAFPNLTQNPVSLTETPGPHRLQHRPARPEDHEYQQRQSEQQRQEQQQYPNGNDPNAIDINNPNHILDIFKSLTKVIANNNKHLHSGDISEPTPFNGADSKWEEWYLQLRTYLEVKDWLTTFEHPTGPGTAGFDLETNKKIYNKLHALCRKGTAVTFITKAAHCDG
jgi:hypothetical protein